MEDGAATACCLPARAAVSRHGQHSCPSPQRRQGYVGGNSEGAAERTAKATDDGEGPALHSTDKERRGGGVPDHSPGTHLEADGGAHCRFSDTGSFGSSFAKTNRSWFMAQSENNGRVRRASMFTREKEKLKLWDLSCLSLLLKDHIVRICNWCVRKFIRNFAAASEQRSARCPDHSRARIVFEVPVPEFSEDAQVTQQHIQARIAEPSVFFCASGRGNSATCAVHATPAHARTSHEEV